MVRLFNVALLFSVAVFAGCGGTSNSPASSPTVSQFPPRSHPLHGKELLLATGPVLGTEDRSINGMAELHAFEDGTAIIRTRINIPSAPSGSVFVVWLGKEEGADVIGLGVLASPTGDVRHILTWERKQEISSFSRIIIRRQLQWNSEQPEGAIVAEGQLIRAS